MRLIFLIAIIISTACGSDKSSYIIGYWQCEKHVKGSRIYNDTFQVLKFDKEGKIYDLSDEQLAHLLVNTYSVSNDTLTIGDQKLLINKLDKNKLILTRIGSLLGSGTDYYHRITEDYFNRNWK